MLRLGKHIHSEHTHHFIFVLSCGAFGGSYFMSSDRANKSVGHLCHARIQAGVEPKLSLKSRPQTLETKNSLCALSSSPPPRTPAPTRVYEPARPVNRPNAARSRLSLDRGVVGVECGGSGSDESRCTQWEAVFSSPVGSEICFCAVKMKPLLCFILFLWSVSSQPPSCGAWKRNASSPTCL